MNFRIRKVICKNCNTENYSDAPFCIKCGGSLISEKKSGNPVFFLAAALFAALQLLFSSGDDGISYFQYLVFFCAFFPAMWVAVRWLKKTGEITVLDQDTLKNSNQKL